MTTVQGSSNISSQFIAGSDVHFDYEGNTNGSNNNLNGEQNHQTNSSNKKKKKKKKKTNSQVKQSNSDSDYPTSRIITGGPQNSVVVTPMDTTSQKKKKKDSHSKDDIWEGSIEGQKALKEFWLTLPKEDQRKLVSISKDNVLQAIRDNDKVNCDCSLCGRKRNAIEKELEVMYESYYDTFNETMNHQSQKLSDDYLNDAAFVDSLFNPLGNNNDGIMSIAEDLLSNNGTKFLDIMEKLAERRMAREDYQHKKDHAHYHQAHPYDDDEEEEEEECDEDACSECGHVYADEEEEDDEDDEFEHDEIFQHNQYCPHHHEESLQSQRRDPISVDKQQPVADEDMKKLDQIIENISDYDEMVEEEDEEDEEDEDEDEEEEDDDDENYDNNESIDEERRFEEARRMIQLFTTRMFHERLLERYRLKVANDRSNKLLEELELEELRKKMKEEKKQLQKEKAKEKKRLQQQAKEEERLKKELEKLELERKIQEEKERRAEEQRRKEEEKRKKKMEEQKKKMVELEKQRKEKLEKERLKKEEKQRKKDEEKRKKDEELELKKLQENEAHLKEVEQQQERLRQLQLEDLERAKSSLLKQELEAKQREKELNVQHSQDSKQLLESLYKAEKTPSPLSEQQNSLSSNQIPPMGELQSQTQPLVSPPVQRSAIQSDFSTLPSLNGYQSPLPPPGILPVNTFNNSMPPHLLQPSVLQQQQQQQQQQEQIPLQHLQQQSLPHMPNDAWRQPPATVNPSNGGSFFDNGTMPIANANTNGFPSFLDKSTRLSQTGLASSLNTPSFNTLTPLATENNNMASNLSNMAPFNDTTTTWGKSDIWLSPETTIPELGKSFNLRSNSIWNDSGISPPPQLQPQLTHQQSTLSPHMMPHLHNDQSSTSIANSTWNNNAVDDLTPAAISLIQQATAQVYQQLSSFGTNWVPRNTLFSQTQMQLSNILNLSMSMFLKSISSPNLNYWFEIHYDDYGAASLIRVGQKEASTMPLNNGSFLPFNSNEPQQPQPQQQSKGTFLSQNSFSGLSNGIGAAGSKENSNEGLYNLWNSNSFSLL